MPEGISATMPLSAGESSQSAIRRLQAQWEAELAQVDQAAAEAAEAGAGEEAAFDAAVAAGTASFLTGAVALLAILGTSVAAAIIAKEISGDNAKREAYTKTFADTASQKYPHYNVVICHPNHTVSPPPGKGSYVIHQHFELGMSVGTCGYDVYFSRKGKAFTFINQGGWRFFKLGIQWRVYPERGHAYSEPACVVVAAHLPVRLSLRPRQGMDPELHAPGHCPFLIQSKPAIWCRMSRARAAKATLARSSCARSSIKPRGHRRAGQIVGFEWLLQIRRSQLDPKCYPARCILGPIVNLRRRGF
jgi:hypothetical protein